MSDTHSQLASPRAWLDAGRKQLGPRSRFLVAGDTTLTYGDIDEHTTKFASYLDQLGIAPGDPVMVISNDPIAVGQLSLAIIRSGRCLCVVDPGGTPREIRASLVVVEPALIFARGDEIDRCELRQDCVWTVVELGAKPAKTLANRLFAKRDSTADKTSWPAVIDNCSAASELPDLDPEQCALIVFTSGSTRRPKGVELSLRAILTHFETLDHVFGFAGSVVHNVLPLSHVDGLIEGPLMTYFNGATWVRPIDFSVAAIPELLDSVYRHQVTHMLVVPTMLALYDRLASDMPDAFDTPDFQMIVSSAGPLPTALWTRFESTFDTVVCNSYGLSETVTSSIASGPESSGTRRVGTIGRPIDCAVELIDEDGAPVPEGQIGEIVITGDHLFSRYRNDEVSTTKVLTDRTFRTGDLAIRDDDGFIQLRGRKSSMIVRGGRNIAPAEIDAVIGQLAGVVQSATTGIDDPMWGQRVETIIITEDTVSSEDVVTHCRRLLSPHKVPQRVLRVNEMPLTPSGKIDAAGVRDRLSGPRHEQNDHSSDIDDVVLRAAARIFGVSEADLSLSSTIDQVDGWDSLAHLDLVGAIEDHFSIIMSNADILGIRNLGDASVITRSHRP